MCHRLKIRVYFEDTDAGGIVYHANYLKFMERGRTEWLSDLGFEQDALLEQQIAFVVKHIDINYAAAAKFNQTLTVSTEIDTCKRASLTFIQSITDDKGTEMTRARVQIACVNIQTLRPCKIPQPILAKLTGNTP